MRALTLLRLTCVVLVLLVTSGSNSMLRSATSNLADNLSSAIFNSDDLTTVERGYRFHKPITELYQASLPFIAVLLLALVIITYCPILTLGMIS